MHQSSFPDSEQTRVIMMSLDLGLGPLTMASNIPPSLDPFLPQIYFSELAIELFASSSIEY
jgi:hypothetical protein